MKIVVYVILSIANMFVGTGALAALIMADISAAGRVVLLIIVVSGFSGYWALDKLADTAQAKEKEVEG